jgi:hypothetical protein
MTKVAIRVTMKTTKAASTTGAAKRCSGDDLAVWSTRADPPIVADCARPAPITTWLDPVLECVDWSCQAQAALERAEEDYNADPEEREEGPIADRMHQAWEYAQWVFDMMLATKPRTHEGLSALITHVSEVARRQNAKGHHDDGPRDLVERLRGVIAIRGVGSVHT